MVKITKGKIIYTAVWLLAGILIPLLFSDNRYYMSIFIMTAIYVILATGMNLLLGFTGQISIGHAAFYGIGAYVTALLSKNAGMPFLVCMLLSIVVCFFSGLVLGIPSYKLGAIYLAMVTIGFNSIIRLVMVNWAGVTGGSSGFKGIPALKLNGESFTKLQFYFLTFAFVVIVQFVFYRLIRSKSGRAFMAVRGNEIAAASMGINVNQYKLLSFAISAAFAGIAGSLYAYHIGYISPESFTVDFSVKLLTMVILGGLGNISGGLVGAVIIGIIPEFLRDIGNYQMTIYGLMIVLMLRFAPNGIMGLFIKLKNMLAQKSAVQSVVDAQEGE